MPSPVTAKYDWILAITTIAFVFSAFGNGANDVANAYATSVAARTLTMVQVGPLAMATEFTGAVALGARVTSTIPFFKRKLIMKDPRVRVWHVILGPLLLKESTTLFWPGQGDEYVTDYYEDAYGEVHAGTNTKHAVATPANVDEIKKVDAGSPSGSVNKSGVLPSDPEKTGIEKSASVPVGKLKKPEPYERWIVPVKSLSWVNPQKWWAYTKFIFLRGVMCDVITHDNDLLRAIHSKARRYDVRVEHLWTYCQVVSAMMMSIAHGSNDVANAVGPWAAVYQTWLAGEVSTNSPTPVWFLVVAGILLGLGFWFYGYHIVRALGNKITQMSPTRGYSVKLGAAITVLLASRLGLPVSTTQCLTGSAVGVALMNYDIGAVNWRQLAFIFFGWVITLPVAGLMSGLLCLMALNAPSF